MKLAYSKTSLKVKEIVREACFAQPGGQHVRNKHNVVHACEWIHEIPAAAGVVARTRLYVKFQPYVYASLKSV